MKDLETNNNRPDREDTDGRPEKEPAYRSFVKDKRARITTSKTTEKVEYRRSDHTGPNAYSSGKPSNNAYRDGSGRNGYAGKGYHREGTGADQRNGERRPSYRDGNSDRDYRSREGGGYDSSYRKRERIPYDRSGEGREGGDTRRSYNPNFDSSNRPVNRTGYGDRQPRENRSGMNYSKESSHNGYEGRNTSADRYGYGQERDRNAYRSGGNDRPGYNKERSGYNTAGSAYDKKPYRGHNEESRRGEDSDRGYGGGKRPYENSRSGAYKGSSYGKPRSEGAGKYGKPAFGKPGQRKGRQLPKYDSENYPTFPAEVTEDKIRLNRYIAMSGICSRREADDFIQSGVVSVNGLTVTELGAKVSQDDEVRFNGNVIRNEKKVYIVMNKPKGYVTSVEDPHADKTVMDLLKNSCRERVYPVGRLDKNSLGVLLITNDGDMAKKLMHPSFEKKKVYQVSLDKPLARADMDALVAGFPLDDGEIHADSVSYVGDKKTEVGIEIHSGRNRIVRRMFEHLGYKVVKLDRVYFAGLTKQRLKRGEWRFLSPREVQALRSGQYE